MIRFLQSKQITASVVGILLVLLAALAALCIHFLNDSHGTATPSMFLEGEYSVDGGKWKTIDPNKEINDTFNKIIFRGKSAIQLSSDRVITVYGKNIWYTLKNNYGEVLAEYRYQNPDKLYNELFENIPESWFSREDFDKTYTSHYALQSNLPHTPGYIVNDIVFNNPESALEKDESITYTLEVEYPYDSPKASFSDCFDISIGSAQSAYARFFSSALPSIMLFSLICFFGLFFFPVAGFILGKTNYKFLTFGALCFSWGLFMIADNISAYLNLWITDSTVCLMADSLTNYLFFTAMLLYLKSNLEQSFNRAVANALAIIYTLLVIIYTVLHLTNVIDLWASSPWMFTYTAVFTAIMAILLFHEAHSNKKAMYMLISWIPLALSIILHAINHYIHFIAMDFLSIGISITLIYQLVQLVLDLRTQYKEAIRYQQMQKELYEAKVSVMVSQIQPHFLYNSLTSIAMMCTKDPKLAKSATINFADYLRGNMNSLKQTAPVPFTQELEHLKKYLMLEQMRFGDMLNIEYDIQTTDFSLPQLSVQPLVENAVKHGVGMKEDGGTVTIATREMPDCYKVIISDDGVGFDTSAPPKNDGRSHVGMENTKQRLKDMCNAEVIIESEPGKGTVSTIIIPKEKNKE